MKFQPHHKESLVSLDEAVVFLKANQPVAIPTETVYGLAAPISSEEGLKAIFEIKARPFFDPLIVHIDQYDDVFSLTSFWPQEAGLLARHFWPGPLTLVVEKSSAVSNLISSGLSTVGLRMPLHPMMRTLISRCGPLAAPSANKFGKTSPTQAQHIIEEYQGLLPVVDGGPCSVGIESTIVKIESSHRITLLRSGMISQEEISQVLLEHQIPFQWQNISEKYNTEISPGRMKHHYMPRVPLVIYDPQRETKQPRISEFSHDLLKEFYLQCRAQIPDSVEGVSLVKPENIKEVHELLLPSSPALAARQLYSLLRETPPSADLILCNGLQIPKTSSWEPIWDRLKKAATLVWS
jgi:L-threonylcarbamoyladenylate synthase